MFNCVLFYAIDALNVSAFFLMVSFTSLRAENIVNEIFKYYSLHAAENVVSIKIYSIFIM